VLRAGVVAHLRSREQAGRAARCLPVRTLVLSVCLVAATTASAAADAPITKQRFRELVRGEHPLAGWTDPTAGVVVIDWPGDDWNRVQPARVRQLCGDDLGAGLPLAMFALGARLGPSWSPAPLSCTNRPTPSCTIGAPADGVRVDFRHDARGALVADAITWASKLGTPAPAVHRRTCVAPAPARPTELTKRLVRELAWGLRPMSDVIDPRRGLVRGSWPNSGAEEDHTPAPRHLCGAALDLEAVRRELLWLADQEERGYFNCRNRPRHECTGSELVDEYSNHHHVVFVDDADRGLVLESWIDLDEGLTSDESQREQRLWAKGLVADARAHPCQP
jgi:hypothetical protein